MMVQKWYAFRRNCTSKFEAESFPGLVIYTAQSFLAILGIGTSHSSHSGYATLEKRTIVKHHVLEFSLLIFTNLATSGE